MLYLSFPPESSGYPQQSSTHVTYANQTVHSYPNPGPAQTPPQAANYPQGQTAGVAATSYTAGPPSSGPTGARYPLPGQSAFTSYPTHYSQHQPKQPLPEGYPQHFQVQRLQQPG